MPFKQIKPKLVSSGYRLYSPTKMTNAYLAVKEHNQSVRGAARQFGVPVRTLRDRTMGKVSVDTVKSGRAPILGQKEESSLTDHIKEMAQLGYGYTRKEVVDLANDFVRILGRRSRDSPLTLRWYQGFMSRWEELRVVKPRALEIQRTKSGNVVTVSSYFDELRDIVQKHNLQDKPHLIFNVDEKGIQQHHSPPAVVAGRQLNAQEVVAQRSSTTTILGCGSAAGVAIPPFFVFAGARMRSEFLSGKSPGADGTVSETGWSNSVVFRKYLEEHFLKYAPGRGDDPILLLLDGHKSHVSVGLVDWAKEHNIILFILPAHTSHFLQPLDVGCYGPFHRIYNNECHKQTRSLSSVITKYDVCAIACKAYTKALSADNLQAAFRKTGIYPLDEDAINRDYLLPSEAFLHQLQEREHDESLEVTEDGDRGNEITAQSQEQESSTPTMTEDFFENKIEKLKKIKSESKTKPRNTMSKITSGKCITEEKVRSKMIDHEAPKKRKSEVGGKENREKKKVRTRDSNSQEAGPSGYICANHVTRAAPSILSLDTDVETDEEEISEEEKCCVCKKFTPDEVRNSVFISFAKWVKCDRCSHWVHLGACAGKRVVRRGDDFLCPHCK